MKKALVTGASGFLGSYFVQRLNEEGYATSVLARPTSDLSSLSGLNYQIFAGDVTQVSSLKKAFEGQDLIIHAAGSIEYDPTKRLQMEAINVGGTKNVITSIQKGQRLLHVSSVVAVGASTEPAVLTEDSPYMLSKYNFGYFETKREAERLVLSAAKEDALWAVAICPSTIYGRSDARKGSRKTQLKVAQGRFPFLPAGGVNIVAVEDVVDGAMKALEKGRNGERYILCGENWTLEKTFREIAKEAQVAPPKIKLNRGVSLALGSLGDLLKNVGLNLGFTYENALVSTMYHWFSCGKAERELGFKARPSHEAIHASVSWMKEQGWLESKGS